MIDIVKLPERPNRHPADEMKDIKLEIENLEARYAVLREWIIAHPGERRGVEWRAKVIEQPNRVQYDIKGIIDFFGKERLAKFQHPSPRTFVNLYPIKKVKD